MEAVRASVLGKTRDALELLGKDVHEVPTRGRRLNAIVSEYMSMSSEERESTLVITAANKDRIELNQKIRQKLVDKGILQPGNSYKVQYGKDKDTQERLFAKGDNIVFLQNDRKIGVMNGTKAHITDINGTNFVVTTMEGNRIQFDIKKYNHIDYGMVQTPHKAQGATYERAIIHLDSKDRKLNSKNSFYVDISRAKHDVKIFCDSTLKLEGQISKFAKKLTLEDFAIKKQEKDSRFLTRKEKLLQDCGLGERLLVLNNPNGSLDRMLDLVKMPLLKLERFVHKLDLERCFDDGPKFL